MSRNAIFLLKSAPLVLAWVGNLLDVGITLLAKAQKCNVHLAIDGLYEKGIYEAVGAGASAIYLDYDTGERAMGVVRH